MQKNTYVFKKVASEYFYNDKGILDTTDQTLQFALYKNGKKLLSHILRKIDGDCNSVGLELGTVEVKDSSINFYSYYAWVGGCCGLPYGARIQSYQINKKGELYLAHSEIYLEEYKEKPTNMKADDRKRWIADTEKAYNATFVVGHQATELLRKVKVKLTKQIKAETSDWPSSYLGKNYGFRK